MFDTQNHALEAEDKPKAPSRPHPHVFRLNQSLYKHMSMCIYHHKYHSLGGSFILLQPQAMGATHTSYITQTVDLIRTRIPMPIAGQRPLSAKILGEVYRLLAPSLPLHEVYAHLTPCRAGKR